MDLIDAAAATGEPAGLVVVADHQTAGRGRAGRSWIDRPGDALLCSILLRPRRRWRASASSLIAGVALSQSVEALTPARPRLRWPNDVLVEERKLAGDLGDVADDCRCRRARQCREGSNLRGRDGLPPEAAALSEYGDVQRDELLTTLTRAFDHWLAHIEAGAYRSALDQWEQRGHSSGSPRRAN